MNAEKMIAMIQKFTDQYGVLITWQSNETTTNSRGVKVKTSNEIIKSAKVLLLKEKFSPLQVFDSGVFGLSQDFKRYILTLPDIEIKKDLVITDNHKMKWKLGIIDWFDIAGTPICKQSSVMEVN